MKAQEFNQYENSSYTRNHPRKQNINLKAEDIDNRNSKKTKSQQENHTNLQFYKKNTSNPQINHTEKGSKDRFIHFKNKKDRKNISDKKRLIQSHFEEHTNKDFGNNFSPYKKKKEKNDFRQKIYRENHQENIKSTIYVKSSEYKNNDLDYSKYHIATNSNLHDIELETELIWGRHPAHSALESGRPIHRVWCTSELKSSSKFFQLLKKIKESNVLIEETTWSRLDQLTKGSIHQGIVLQIAAVETFELINLIEACSKLKKDPLFVAVEGLTDPHNLGAIIRSAEALGAHGLVLPQRRSAGLTGSVAKVAAGALEHLPVARVINLNRSLHTLKENGYRIIGLAEEGNTTLIEADLNGPLAIVIGSEGDGLSLLTRRHCDQLIRIPLCGSTPSLNASVASALMLYEIARRSWMQGLSDQSPAPRIVRPLLKTKISNGKGWDDKLIPHLQSQINRQQSYEVLKSKKKQPVDKVNHYERLSRISANKQNYTINTTINIQTRKNIEN